MTSVETRNFAPLPFTALELSLDDRLPADIRLLMGFRGLLDAGGVHAALASGLLAFPHLTGRRAGTADHPLWRIEPLDTGTALEVRSLPGRFSIGDLEGLTAAEHSERFMPGETVSPVLFRACLTLLPESGLSLLALRVSHLAVDGTGLALFVAHATAAGRGMPAPPVFHERSHGFGSELNGPDDLPEGYAEVEHSAISPWLADLASLETPVLFAVPVADARLRLEAASLLDARLRLGAWLCGKLSELHPAFSEVALWCDPRGLNGIPPTYTGNSGCYLHFRLSAPDALTRELRGVTTRAGFARIADISRRIKRAESQGRHIRWDGPGAGVLQLNLVPHAVSGADFGSGLPVFGLMLSRNSSGLRLSVTPDGTRFLVEACLAGNLGKELFEAAREEGLEPVRWGAGGSPSVS